jgi:AraC-like DNA-binding protein
VSHDPLSEVLRAVRLSGAAFFAVDASAPWVAETPPGRAIGAHLMPGAEHVIDYHVITSGSCWAGIVEEPAVRLDAGDVIVFPKGDAHVLSSAPGMRGTVDESRLQAARLGRLPIAIVIDGGGPERAGVICGFLGCDERPFNPLLSALPRVIHIKKQDTSSGFIEQFMGVAAAESAAERAGGECVLARLSEVLFVEVVRRYVATLPPENVGWLAGLRDESIGRVLSKMHGRPAHPWNLDDLAREVGLSRSVLAERFLHFVGVPPMQYLTQWRLQLAANLLASTSLGHAEIAERVGYGSETTLSRAFKRELGVGPAEWRRGKRDELRGNRASSAQ